MNKAIQNRTIFECRFRYGYEYLDKTGRIIRRIVENNFPNFSLSKVNTTLTALEDKEKNIIINLDTTKLVIEQVQGENNINLMKFEEFKPMADIISQIIKEELKLNDFSKLGYRNIYFIGFNTIQECTDYLLKLKLFIKLDTETVFSKIKEFSSLFVFDEDDYTIRIKLSVGQQPVNVPEHIINLAIQDTKKLSRDQKRKRKEQYLAKNMLAKLPKYVVIYDFDFIDEFPELILGTLDIDTFLEKGNDLSKKYFKKIFEANL